MGCGEHERMHGRPSPEDPIMQSESASLIYPRMAMQALQLPSGTCSTFREATNVDRSPAHGPAVVALCLWHPRGCTHRVLLHSGTIAALHHHARL